jgi:hypothetical protein
MYLVDNWVWEFEGLIVVSVGSRTLARSLVVSAVSAGSRGPQPRPLQYLDHRDMVLIWIMRGFGVEGEEEVVVIMRCGALMFRSIGSP